MISYIYTLIALGLLVSNPALSKTYDLGKLKAIGIKNNFNIKVSRLEVEKSEISTNQKRQDLWLPSLNSSLSRASTRNYEGFKSTSLYNNVESTVNVASLELSYDLFNGFEDYYSYKNAIANENLKKTLHQEDIQTYLFNLDTNFLNLSSALNRLKIYNDINKNDHELMKLAEDKFKKGVIKKSDFLLAKINYLDSQQNMNTYTNVIEKLKNTLRSLLSSEDQSFNNLIIRPYNFKELHSTKYINMVQKNSIESILSSLLDAYKMHSPDFKASELEVSVANTNNKIQRASFFPTLNLNAFYNQKIYGTYDSFQVENGMDNFGVVLTLTIPIFDNFSDYREYTKSKISINQASLQQRQKLLEANYNLRSEVETLKTLIKNFKSAVEKSNFREQIYKSTIKRFSLGLVGIRDAIEDRNSLNNDLLEVLNLHHGIETAILKLKKLTGQIEV